jgi:benzodiazapine receptor
MPRPTAECNDRLDFAGQSPHLSAMTVPIIIAVLWAIGLLGLGAWLTPLDKWYDDLRKPSWQPPGWAFGPAWTLILGMAAAAGVLAWQAAPDATTRTDILILFGVNGFFHLLWSPLFFRWRRPDLALVEVVFLWASIVALIVGVAPLSTTAAWLLAPYILWVSFAAFLNLTIVRMNRPFA